MNETLRRVCGIVLNSAMLLPLYLALCGNIAEAKIVVTRDFGLPTTEEQDAWLQAHLIAIVDTTEMTDWILWDTGTTDQYWVIYDGIDPENNLAQSKIYDISNRPIEIDFFLIQNPNVDTLPGTAITYCPSGPGAPMAGGFTRVSSWSLTYPFKVEQIQMGIVPDLFQCGIHGGPPSGPFFFQIPDSEPLHYWNTDREVGLLPDPLPTAYASNLAHELGHAGAMTNPTYPFMRELGMLSEDFYLQLLKFRQCPALWLENTVRQRTSTIVKFTHPNVDPVPPIACSKMPPWYE